MGENVITTELAIFILMLIGGLAGLWWRIDSKHTELDDKINRNTNSLSAHRLHSAETFQTKVAAAEAFTSVLAELKGMRADFREMLTSLDKRLREMETLVARSARDNGGQS